MIISEKQIMQLIECANQYVTLCLLMNNDEHTEYSEKIDKLLCKISDQQSEKLIEVKDESISVS